jgi:hypothetical protein
MEAILKLKIAHVIGVNGLLEQCRCEHEGMSLWQDVGNNWWNWDQIVETAHNVTDAELIEGMQVDGQVTNAGVADMLSTIADEDPFHRAAFN